MKTVSAIFIIIILLLISANPARASLITIEKSGGIIWKVLAEEDQHTFDIPRSYSLEVKEVRDTKVDEDSKVTLSKNNGTISLLVKSGNSEKSLDVAGWEDNIVEVEERPETQKISFALEGDGFAIRQKGIRALTSFPIKIDPDSARVTLTTSTGDVFLAVKPRQAVETVFKSKLISKITDNKIELAENERELQYVVKGEKNINIANVYVYSFPIELRLSALTGEVVAIDSPSWFKYFSFLFA